MVSKDKKIRAGLKNRFILTIHPSLIRFDYLRKSGAWYCDVIAGICNRKSNRTPGRSYCTS